MYSEFVIFIEACESGSLFADMDLQSINIWALTATNATSPSFGTYCYPHDLVNGTNMYSCLGDMFSVSWMQFLEENKKELTS
jgi:legumain